MSVNSQSAGRSFRKRPRNYRRRQMPMSGGGVNVELQSDQSGTAHYGVVWDLCQEGACVLVRSKRALRPNLTMQLLLYPSIGAGQLNLNVTCCWSQPQGEQCFVGLKFAEPLLSNAGFLRPYLIEPPSIAAA